MFEQRQHILIMSSWFPTRLDPFAGNFVLRFAVLLQQKYDVTVIHTMGDRSLSKQELIEEEVDGVRICRVYHPVSINKLKHWWYQRKALRTVLNEVHDVDLIFAHVLYPRGLQFEKAKRFFHCPLIVMEHASYYRESIIQTMSSLQRAIIKRVSGEINHLIAVSEVLKTDMKTLFPTTKIDVIPNPIDPQFFSLKTNFSDCAKQFIHVSTLDLATKNPQILFEGFRLAIIEQQLNIHLTVVSDQRTDNWQKWVVENGISAHVQFVGPLEWEQIGELMRESDALIQTSSYETFSIVLAEAWLTGIPVITTSVGIGTDLPIQFGIQIPHNDAEALSNAIADLASDSSRFIPTDLREKGMEYCNAAVFQQLESCFESFLIDHE